MAGKAGGRGISPASAQPAKQGIKKWRGLNENIKKNN